MKLNRPSAAMAAGRPSEAGSNKPRSLDDLKSDEQRFHFSMPEELHRRIRMRSAMLRIPMTTMVVEWVMRGIDEDEAAERGSNATKAAS